MVDVTVKFFVHNRASYDWHGIGNRDCKGVAPYVGSPSKREELKFTSSEIMEKTCCLKYSSASAYITIIMGYLHQVALVFTGNCLD